ncbi:MAG TPA: phosphate signaling complex protein PhoU [Candidatus Limnocylindrales bacterium]|nr:phosphate signaling complex protein PhoU [Candidatus Limnocylindrales bacterium]
MTEPRNRPETPTVDQQVERLLQEDQPQPTDGPARRDPLDVQEQEIKDAVLRMGALVEEAIRRAAQSLVDHDAELALDVIKGDVRINDAQREVSRMISVAIATQQPVARDLRYLLTLDHVTYELERMGDHAGSLAKQVRKLAPEPPLAGYSKLPEMAERSAVLVHGVLRALVDADAVAAREVAVLDDDIDRLYHATFDEVVDLMRADPANVERGTRIIIASHYIERIGDRSTNIAEDIVYVVTGDVEDLNP